MFPSTITSFSYPSATDRLNNPSHSGLENLQSSAIGQIQTFVGLSTSSAVGTLMYDIRSPDSNGGGHVQTANKGGTGQTSYTKGDILVATSASVLSKLAAGADGQALVYNSSLAAGIGPGIASSNKVIVSSSVITFIGSHNPTPETSIVSITISGSTLGTSNAVKATLFTAFTTFNNACSVVVRARYGGGVVSSVIIEPTSNTTFSVAGEIRFALLANGATNAQRGVLQVDLKRQQTLPTGAVSVVSLYNTNTSSVESSANQTLGITFTANPTTIANIDGYVIEKVA